MTDTLPDYSSKGKVTRIETSFDLNELAARLGSPSLLDRRGNIVWYDDFESANAVKWQLQKTGAGTLALSTERAWMGNQSMKAVTGALITDACQMTKSISSPFSHRMGLEIMYHISANKPIILIELYGYSGSKVHTGKMKFDYNTSKLYYYNNSGDYVELTLADSYHIDEYQWIPIKLVIDWETNEYVRILFGGTEYDMSDIPMYSDDESTKQRMRIAIVISNATAAAATVYIDNIIFTQNE